MKIHRTLLILILSTYFLPMKSSEESQKITTQENPSHHEEVKIPFGSSWFFLFVFYACALCLFAGVMSGLTVGYNSIDPLSLELILHGGTEEEVA